VGKSRGLKELEGTEGTLGNIRIEKPAREFLLFP
jgi:hypothetical protein